ncbi:MAG: hypothetical protein ACLFSY_09485 [Desulfonatronovibrionaceae bacterium]
MENRIFELGLTVEGTSLYLLLDAVGEPGYDINMQEVRDRWQSTETKLQESIQELKAHKVAVESEAGLRVMPVEGWVDSSRS